MKVCQFLGFSSFAKTTGSCYPPELHYESPTTFQSDTLYCSGPYNDPRNYGKILGFLWQILPLMFEE